MRATNPRTTACPLSFSRLLLSLALLLGAAVAYAAPASAAITSSVRSACMSDYFAYCAGLEVGSSELRRCMSRAGPKLSSACVSALVAAGEVSKAEVSRRKGASSVASMPRKSRSAKAASRSTYASASRRGKRMLATLR